MANEMRDRLIKDLRISKTEWLEKECDHETDKELVEYVADYLIDDGWIRPPCKVGEVWIDGQGRKVAVEGMYVSELTSESVYFRYVDEDKYGDDLMAVNFIFWQHNFTKAEAEQKLKEMRGE